MTPVEKAWVNGILVEVSGKLRQLSVWDHLRKVTMANPYNPLEEIALRQYCDCEINVRKVNELVYKIYEDSNQKIGDELTRLLKVKW